MKHLFLLFLICILGCQSSNNHRKIKCILSHYEPPSISCGIFSVWWGMKFKDQKTCKEFIGFVNCPDAYDSGFFSTGKMYVVIVKPERPDSTDGLILSGYDIDKLKEYKIQEIKVDNVSKAKCR